MNKYQETIEFIKTLKSSDSQQEANYRTLEDIVQELVDKETPKRVLAEDVGYNQYTDENIYGLKCPSCETELIRAGDNDINVEDPNSEDILKAFNERYDFVSDEFNVNYCPECGRRLDFKHE
ncbi:MAG: hypothetical protein M0Q88_00245 [Bacilli bacterium]|nr:hypothetical protein [Bacilli bacterium]